MKSFEFTGKNIEKAIENGLKELNKNREDVDIKILSEGGFFSKAKVLISFDEESDEQIACDIAKEEISCDCEDCDCEKDCDCEDCDCEDDCNCDCDCEEGCECECECEKVNCEDDCDCGCCEDECECCECTQEETCECNNSEQPKQEKEQEILKKEHNYLSSEEVFDIVNEIFKNIFKTLNIDGKVMILENDDTYEVKVSGDENISSLIGFRGEALNAYQILINSFLSLKNKSKKILLDVENYRNRREESLKGLALRIAKKVVKTKRSHKFEPMSSFERHVIHEALSDFEGVTTHSEGVEPHRQLIVEPSDKNKNN